MSVYEHIGAVTASEAVKSITEQLKDYQIPYEALEIIELGIRNAVTVGISAAQTVRKSTQ